nr:MAG TPA: hypothetical protein [Caudoviricetes sp.]DAN34798.1 MAG TPA: hypothetical protein [Caudoviricetes sp.]
MSPYYFNFFCNFTPLVHCINAANIVTYHEYSKFNRDFLRKIIGYLL